MRCGCGWQKEEGGAGLEIQEEKRPFEKEGGVKKKIHFSSDSGGFPGRTSVHTSLECSPQQQDVNHTARLWDGISFMHLIQHVQWLVPHYCARAAQTRKENNEFLNGNERNDGLCFVAWYWYCDQVNVMLNVMQGRRKEWCHGILMFCISYYPTD